MAEPNAIVVTGATGLAGSAVVRALHRAGNSNVFGWSQRDLDLEDEGDVGRRFATDHAIGPSSAIIHCAGAVSGLIGHLARPAMYGIANAHMALNVISSAWVREVPRLIMLGSGCIYPVDAKVPTPEEAFFSGRMEPSNLPYATAKILQVVLCDAIAKQDGLDWITLQPANLYGPGDRFADPSRAHVIPAIMHKVHWAKVQGRQVVTLPGNGQAIREFLHADDLGDAVVFCLANVHRSDIGTSLLNVSSCERMNICQLAAIIAEAVGYEGRVVFSGSDENGAKERGLDGSRLEAFGWRPTRRLATSLRDIYEGVTNWGKPWSP